MMRPSIKDTSLTVLLTATFAAGGCATADPAESVARAECKSFARQFEHSGRMKDACLINRGYEQVYDSVGGPVKVRSTATPRQAAEAVASDLKACNDETSRVGFRWGGVGIDQFVRCMQPRGYAVTVIR